MKMVYKVSSVFLSAVLAVTIANNLALSGCAQGKVEDKAFVPATQTHNPVQYEEINKKPNPTTICDYTRLLNALNEAERFPEENDGRFSEEVWKKFFDSQEYAQKLNQERLIQNKQNQKVIDKAASELLKAISNLEKETVNKYFITVVNNNGKTVQTISLDKNVTTLFGDVKAQINPVQNPDDYSTLLEWVDENGNAVADDFVINGDLTINPTFEYKQIVVQEKNNNIKISLKSDNKYFHGINANSNTVRDIEASLKNDQTQIIVTRNGNVLGTDDLIGTGCVIKCVSKKNPSVVYDSSTVVLYGDINGDGKINSQDYKLLSKVAFYDNYEPVTNKENYIAADLDGDGAIDGFDYTLLDLQIAGVREFNQSTVIK